MTKKGYIPNIFTSINLILGCLAIIEIFEGKLEYVPYYVWLAGVVDFLDGFSARLTSSTSPIGKDLDSLADLVSFGVVPSLLVYSLLKQYSDHDLLPYLAIFIAVFSALRLAKFNNDERQLVVFYGLNTPANALFFTSIPLLISEGIFLPLLQNVTFLSVVTVVFSLLLVSDIKFMAFKFKKFSWKGNEVKISFLVIAIALMFLFQFLAIPIIITLYILTSIIQNMLPSAKEK
ncbi:MAG: CDP-diacylglycerol--serine O-phosphatidyltransferase [Cyclobacteriaceae bacterium]